MVAPYDFNTIPTELDADGVNPRVGRDKVDPDPGHDPNTQVLALEWNLVKKWIPKLVGFVGGEVAPVWDSLRGRASGDTFVMLEDFTTPVVMATRWFTTGTAPTFLQLARGGYSFTLDEAVNPCEMGTYGYTFNRAQKPRWRCRYTLDGNPNVNFLVQFIDPTGNEGWGIKFLTAGTKIQGFTRTGGVDTDKDVSTWVVSTEVLVDAYISGTNLWISVNGGTPVDCGAVVAADVRLQLWAPTGGAAGKVMVTRTGLLLADWSV